MIGSLTVDALQLFNEALGVLRTDLRESKAELLKRFDRQDEMLGSLDERVREANGKTAKHVTDIALLRRDVDELASVKFRESRSHALAQDEQKTPAKPTSLLAAMTSVLISWGDKAWFPYIVWFLIASVGGEKAYQWGKAIIALFTPHS